MSRTQVFLRCMHPELESARKEIWERPDENGRRGRQPRSVGQLLGKPTWEKPLADLIFILQTNLSKLKSVRSLTHMDSLLPNNVGVITKLRTYWHTYN
jgi:hypothetical protein